MQHLLAIAYVSSATHLFSSKELDSLLLDAREFNARVGLSGALLHQSGSFFQYLEGHESEVEQAYLRIKASRRHRGLIELVNESVDKRYFSEWSMGFAESTASELQAISQAQWHVQRQAISMQGQDALAPGLRLLLSFWQRIQNRR